ncbi:hypothetical protein KA025_02850 [Candidatus Saccharibacteria bacterium]|jgi:hypothetical protein|nr:hypothetical protein [Candidatus Saccharibacteria bacterium]MBP9813018.1 hypothetical protein [Candidatus Saccharibacteria bacterium]
MNPKENEKPNEPQVIAPQWQYTSGQLSQSSPINQAPNQQSVLNNQPESNSTEITSQPEQIVNPTVSTLNTQTNELPNMPPTSNDPNAILSWRASEFSSSEKNSGWYILLFLGAIVFAVFTFFLTKQIFSAVVIVVMAIAVAVYATIKPRTLNYSIEQTGIRVGDKFYSFDEFRSFGVLDDMAVPSLHLVPIKKLMMPITIYVAPSELDNVVETLGNYLPYQEKKRDFTDKLSHRLRF